MTRQLALDIECVPRTPKPDFDNPAGAWKTFAVALSFRASAQSDPETAVFIRRSDSKRALRKLLCAAANWTLDRTPIDAMTTYNGVSFDMKIINHHIEEIEAQHPDLAAFVHRALSISHRDLFAEIIDTQPAGEKWPSLAEALTSRGIESPTTKLDSEVVTGALMPAIGARVLDPDAELGEHEEQALRKYAASDVEPLFELSDALDEERNERIAAEAHATKQGQSATNTQTEADR